MILPIIVMSSHNSKGLVETAYEAGANEWMSKPVNSHEAGARILEQVLATQKSNTDSNTPASRQSLRLLLERLLPGLCYATVPLQWSVALTACAWIQTRLLQLVGAEAEARMLQHFLPKAVIRKLQGGALPFTEDVPQATFLFADIVGFTTMCSTVSAKAVVDLLHALISAFDEATGPLGVFKVDTVGERMGPFRSPRLLGSPFFGIPPLLSQSQAQTSCVAIRCASIAPSARRC